MTINTELLTKYIQPFKTFIRRYGPYIYLALVATVISFLMLRISSLNGYEVNDTDVSSDVKPISINDKQADIILHLDSWPVDTQPNSNTGRVSPF